MGGIDFFSAGRFDGGEQSIPVSMIREDKTSISVPPAHMPPYLHPAAAYAQGIGHKTPHPGGVSCGGRADDEIRFKYAMGCFGGDTMEFRQVPTLFTQHLVGDVDGAVGPYFGADIFQVIEEALCFAKAVAQEYAGLAGLLVVMYPLPDVVKDDLLGLPVIDGEAKGTLGDESLTGYGFEGSGDAIIFGFVVTTGYPNGIAMLYPNLGGANDMAGGVEGDGDPVDVDLFTVFHTLHGDVGTEAEFQDGNGVVVTEVGLAAAAGVVGMSVGDDGLLNRLPGVDVEVTGGAVDAFVCELE